MTVYLYKIRNDLNEKLYFGQTIHPETRWKEHLKYSRMKLHARSMVIHRAMVGLGVEHFSFEVLPICFDNQKEADEIETHLIENFKTRVPNGYNVSLGGHGGSPRIGMKNSPEHRKALRDSNIGRAKSSTHREAISKTLMGRKTTMTLDQVKARNEKVRLAWEKRKKQMSWADKYVEMLREGSNVQFRPQGKSMEPLIKAGQLVTMRPVRTLGDAQVGNMVLCRVDGKFYLHLISAVDENKRIQVSNKGHVNGWTTLQNVYGVVTKVE